MSIGLDHLSKLLGSLHNRHDRIGGGPDRPQDGIDGPDDSDSAGDPQEARRAAERQAADDVGERDPLRRPDGPQENRGNDGANRSDGHHHNHGPDRGDGPGRGDNPGRSDGRQNVQNPNPGNNANASSGLPGNGLNGSVLGNVTNAAGNLVGNALDHVSNTLNAATNGLGSALNHLADARPLLPPGATPLIDTATNAANALLSQTPAAGMAERTAMMAQNALHNAATSASGSTTLGAPLQAGATTIANAPGQPPVFNPQAQIPLQPTARAAETAVIPARPDVPSQTNFAQAASQAPATLPAAGPPPAAPAAAGLATQAAIQAAPLAAMPMAVPPSQSPVDGRPMIGSNDRGGSSRGDLSNVPPGYTGEINTGRRNAKGIADGESMMTKLVRLLATIGLGTAAANDAEVEEYEVPGQPPSPPTQAWLFWALAIVGYGCLGVALVVLLPGGSGFLDETRNVAGKYALGIGLMSSLGAWWLARKMARGA